MVQTRGSARRHATSHGKSNSRVVELRQYTLQPGKRDVLIDIFERHFIDAQERAGVEVIGQFRDLDNADRFVWLRGFGNMAVRARALDSFYTSQVWNEHRDAVNRVLVNYENVLLLRPARRELGFHPGSRSALDAARERESIIVATIYSLGASPSPDFLEFFENRIWPVLADAGAERLAVLVTESSANNYPRLAIREGENVLVWFARFSDRTAHERWSNAIANSQRWAMLDAELKSRLSGSSQTLRLVPGVRSALA